MCSGPYKNVVRLPERRGPAQQEIAQSVPRKRTGETGVGFCKLSVSNVARSRWISTPKAISWRPRCSSAFSERTASLGNPLKFPGVIEKNPDTPNVWIVGNWPFGKFAPRLGRLTLLSPATVVLPSRT